LVSPARANGSQKTSSRLPVRRWPRAGIGACGRSSVTAGRAGTRPTRAARRAGWISAVQQVRIYRVPGEPTRDEAYHEQYRHARQRLPEGYFLHNFVI